MVYENFPTTGGLSEIVESDLYPSSMTMIDPYIEAFSSGNIFGVQQTTSHSDSVYERFYRLAKITIWTFDNNGWIHISGFRAIFQTFG